MSKTPESMETTVPAGQACPPPSATGGVRCLRPRIALLSNPKSTGNLAQLPRIRAYCADHPDVFHYEVEHVHQVSEALKVISRVQPKVLVINGGDGTVQAALTQIYNGGHFGDQPPPVAVLPSGKTNLIALDLGVQGDPIAALERLIELAKTDLARHVVPRELIALRRGEADAPVIGMFLGGAGLADTMLYCRQKIYPLGLPNSVSHVLTAFAVFARQLLGLRASFLPPDPRPLSVQMRSGGQLTGRFALLAVTTLEKFLLSSRLPEQEDGRLKLVAIEGKPGSIMRGFFAGLAGRLGRQQFSGVHVEAADEIQIEGDGSSVILDGETFAVSNGSPVLLRRAQPLSFVRLAA